MISEPGEVRGKNLKPVTMPISLVQRLDRSTSASAKPFTTFKTTTTTPDSIPKSNTRTGQYLTTTASDWLKYAPLSVQKAAPAQPFTTFTTTTRSRDDIADIRHVHDTRLSRKTSVSKEQKLVVSKTKGVTGKRRRQIARKSANTNKRMNEVEVKRRSMLTVAPRPVKRPTTAPIVQVQKHMETLDPDVRGVRVCRVHNPSPPSQAPAFRRSRPSIHNSRSSW